MQLTGSRKALCLQVSRGRALRREVSAREFSFFCKAAGVTGEVTAHSG